MRPHRISAPPPYDAREQIPLEHDEEQRRRRIDGFDAWLFLSIWTVIIAASGLAIALHFQ